jgi:hypothetical protein
VKSLHDVADRHPGFDGRKPDLPPLPPVLPGEDPPPPDYRWVLPLILALMICTGVVSLMLFALDLARS